MVNWNPFRQESPLDRLLEEQLYAQVVSDLRNGDRRDGLWAKALVEARGNEADARHRYIKLCVQALRDELELARALQPEPATETPERSHRVRVAHPSDVQAIDRYDESGRTPLMNAARDGDLSQVRSLLARGANPYIVDESFGTSTAFDIAARESKAAPGKASWAEILELLRER
jgi:ankyrin repeat protein